MIRERCFLQDKLRMSRQIVFITRTCITNEESGGVDNSCVKHFPLGLSKIGKKTREDADKNKLK